MSIKWIDLLEQDFQRKDHNYMLTDPLGVTTQGCCCQNVYAFLIEDGEIIEYEEQSDGPVHLRKCKQEWKDRHLVQRNGKWYIKEFASEYFEIPDHLPREVIDGVEMVLDDRDLVEVNGEIRVLENCSSYEESRWNWEGDMMVLPNGLYLILLEHACFTTFHYEAGYEGDSEHAIALLRSIPLDYKGLFDAVEVNP